MSETRKRTPPRSKKILSDDDLYLFNEGRHLRLYRKLGAQRESRSRRNKVHFAVWAPDADQVSVVGSFNDWNGDTDPLRPIGSSGVWAGSVNDVIDGSIYKYRIHSRTTGETLEKADPYAFAHEVPPKTASVVWSLDYDWSDDEWMRDQRRRNSLEAPMSIYEVHIGSWKRVPEDDYRSLSYLELAPQLADYVQASGFTHVEFMPVMEHPFFGSWGYQVTGFYAPSSRYGTPQDFMYLVDYLHQRGIGVLLDWVPSHFPTDPHGLGRFDGTHLYEHADPRQGIHPDWNSYVFNYGRNEVRSFLLSNAMYWLDVYHADGLRVDAVASMLYLDYSRAEGEWIPNKFGGRENLEAIDFLRQFNEDVYREFPDVQTIAEESTAWPMVSRPTYLGGLGFGLKWDMGWMHDTLEYMRHDPVHRKFHHNMLTFRMIYAFTENFVLALSHDEVTHGKGSLLGKMPGDDWQKLANLRLLLSYMFFQPGKKLLFMGDEIGQWSEWAHDGSIDWDLLNYEPHQGILRCLQTLNALYRDDDALHQLDVDPAGFSWIDGSDSQQSVISMLRRGRNPEDSIVGIFNFTPVPRYNYLVGVPSAGYWREIFNSDASEYGGSGMGNLGGVWTNPASAHGQFQSLTLTVPPLGALLLKADGGGEPAE